MYQLRAKTLYTAEGKLEDKVLVFNESIQRILSPEDAATIEAEDLGSFEIVAPGFIDIHIHGSRGADAMDGTFEAIETFTSALPENGVTSFLPTTMTQTKPAITKALETIRAFKEKQKTKVLGADILGVYLEGPFISKHKCGAQDPLHIIPPTPKNRAFLEPFHDLVKIIVVAPEVEGALEAIHEWTKEGIICSLGHTDCEASDAVKGYEAGLVHVTHCFNAMTPLHHRKPGAVGAALTLPMVCEMIVDGVHLDPIVVRLLCEQKPLNQRILVTDAMRAAMLGEGESELGGQKVLVKDGKATLEDGTIAGSVLTLDQALRNMHKFTNLELEEIFCMLSKNQAEILGLEDKKGQIKIGLDSDLVCLSRDLIVEKTIVRGQVQYTK